ncbi:MAG: hypothetical protein KAU29_09110, partial [Gammaproteobacteria bacterium]|nr:hypothetical protein [Gammaproteobacteria bacterium]
TAAEPAGIFSSFAKRYLNIFTLPFYYISEFNHDHVASADTNQTTYWQMPTIFPFHLQRSPLRSPPIFLIILLGAVRPRQNLGFGFNL